MKLVLMDEEDTMVDAWEMDDDGGIFELLLTDHTGTIARVTRQKIMDALEASYDDLEANYDDD